CLQNGEIDAVTGKVIAGRKAGLTGANHNDVDLFRRAFRQFCRHSAAALAYVGAFKRHKRRTLLDKRAGIALRRPARVAANDSAGVAHFFLRLARYRKMEFAPLLAAALRADTSRLREKVHGVFTPCTCNGWATTVRAGMRKPLPPRARKRRAC